MSIEPVSPLLNADELRENEVRKRALIELFASDEAVMVVGSGCSARLKYPAWDALLSMLEDLARDIATDSGVEFEGDDSLKKDDPLCYAGRIKAFISEYDAKLDKYYAFLGDQFSEREIDPFHQLLVKLPTRGIVTTNYDPSLELALLTTDRSTMTADRFFVLEDDSRHLVSDFLASFNRGSGIPRRIAHIHGRFHQPAGIILTDSDYDLRYHSRLSPEQREAIRELFGGIDSSSPQVFSVDGMIQQLESAVPAWTIHRKLLWSILATRRVVFVGFSLNDPYLAQMLQLVTDDLWRWRKAHHFAIMPLSDLDTAESKARAEQFRKKYAVGVVFYENRGSQRHEGLVSLIDEIATYCGVTMEAKLEPSGSSQVPPIPATKNPDWLDKANQTMKQRVVNDAN